MFVPSKVSCAITLGRQLILSNAYYTMHYGDHVHPILGGCGVIALEKCYHFFFVNGVAIHILRGCAGALRR